ncbi:MAG TPA: DUF4430 domain-containing protein [Solirubrobacteraceae bacterium]|nr:DUF4430 domain-containing protein [Solirubrobacteraceae bacterium]
MTTQRMPALGALGAMLVALALALGGCGLITASAPTAVQLVITSDFGAHSLHRSDGLRARGGETVLALLRSVSQVSTGAGGDIVSSIDGLSAGPEGGASGRRAQWFYYVNGVPISSSPATTSVRPGDHVWWDLHDASQGAAATAVVGSFPEPFLNGVEGKRLPVRVECTSASSACSTVTASLRRFSVPAAVAAIGSGGAPETLRVLVGPWSRVGGELAVRSIERGPRISGVDANFSAGGQTLTLLGEQGQPVQRLNGDAGLVAATRGAKEAPVWLVTGTDNAGVELAARAFKRATLEDRFAVALRPGAAIALPVRSPAL